MQMENHLNLILNLIWFPVLGLSGTRAVLASTSDLFLRLRGSRIALLSCPVLTSDLELNESLAC